MARITPLGLTPSSFARVTDVIGAGSLTSGEEVFDRRFLTSRTVGTGLSGTLHLTYFTARKTETITQVRTVTGNVAAGATPTLCRVGLFEAAADESLTLVAATANDTTLWAATNSAYQRALTGSLAKVAGRRYAMGLLVVTGAALPQFFGAGNQTNISTIYNAAPRLAATLNSAYADLPASITAAAITGNVSQTNVLIYGEVLP